MPTCKQIDLKSLPGIASSHLTGLLDELTDRGLVCRGRSSEDRRQVLLSLTERQLSGISSSRNFRSRNDLKPRSNVAIS